MKRIVAHALFLAAALGLPTALEARQAAESWEIGPWIKGRNYSEGMPRRPASGSDGSIHFDFPMTGRGQVDAMTTRVKPLFGARKITMRYRIEAEPGAEFAAVEAPNEPATVSLYLQRAGDNWSAKGKFASYRWYVPSRAVINLAPGEHTVAIGLWERWTNVWGHTNVDDPSGFESTLKETANLGIAFGSSSGRSHGVYATRPARFVLLDLEIE